MSAAPNQKPIYYNANHSHGVDEKRRLQIPAKWRPEEEGAELTLMFWPKHKAGACLRVLPPEQMAKLLADINALPNGDPNKVMMKRFVGSESEQVTLDKAGRICLPEKMRTGAGIKDQAVLVGMLDYFEIWDAETLDKARAMDASPTVDALAKFLD
ncbi:MAG TPA: cell division/cell wall cluster transcriptional repressor MraZ [Verrucomicrobiae bacterium]|jgi:MraZ protein